MKKGSESRNIVGYFVGVDSAACVIKDGKIASYIEEERLIRFKHANNIFPIRAIQECLQIADLDIKEIDYFAYGWNAPFYTNGGMKDFYERINKMYPPDNATKSWQNGNISLFTEERLKKELYSYITKTFAISIKDCPPLKFFPHHKSQAAAAFFLSPFNESLVLSIDGSGDTECTTLWHGKDKDLKLIDRIEIPHSLGWFYAAITEFLGFSAYDGEYKVMGLAAYGRPNEDIKNKLKQVLFVGAKGWDYELNPKYIHHGKHTYSGRFTDSLVDLMKIKPRQGDEKLKEIHEDIAYEAQSLLEVTVKRILKFHVNKTGLKNLCIGGGVGLNVKMNSMIHKEDIVENIWPFPVPSDSGTSIGAAIGLYLEEFPRKIPPINNIYWGPSYSDNEIEDQIISCGIKYTKPQNISLEAARLISEGNIIGWVQNRMEAGPRALGARSILADPRYIKSRDRVNSAIKFREYWRPFCPSITEENIERFLKKPSKAPYMILAFEATELAKELVPACVHIDNTMRVQTVNKETNQRYYELIKSFEDLTGIPVILNTSFNIKGEAVVCSPRDALRTFWSTGIDALAIGNCLIKKTAIPVELNKEKYIR